MEPIVVRTKSEMAFDALRDMIISGQIEQRRIYSVAELEEKLNISRTPLAKALSQLEEQGVVELVPKAGMRVLPLRSADLEEHARLVGHVAKLVVEWAVPRAAPKSVNTLREPLAEMREAIETRRQGQYFTSSRDFHLKLCDLAQTSHCRRFFESNWNYEGWYCYNLAQNKEALLDLLGDHEALVNAIEAQDLPHALALCDEHVEKCIRLLKKNAGKIDPA